MGIGEKPGHDYVLRTATSIKILTWASKENLDTGMFSGPQRASKCLPGHRRKIWTRGCSPDRNEHQNACTLHWHAHSGYRCLGDRGYSWRRTHPSGRGPLRTSPAQQQLTNGVAVQQQLNNGVAVQQQLNNGVAVQQQLTNEVAAQQQLNNGVTVQQQLTNEVAAQQQLNNGVAVQQQCNKWFVSNEYLTPYVCTVTVQQMVCQQ